MGGWSEKVSRLKAFYEEKVWDMPPKYPWESEIHALLVPGIAFISQEVLYPPQHGRYIYVRPRQDSNPRLPDRIQCILS